MRKEVYLMDYYWVWQIVITWIVTSPVIAIGLYDGYGYRPSGFWILLGYVGTLLYVFINHFDMQNLWAYTITIVTAIYLIGFLAGGLKQLIEDEPVSKQ